VFSTISRKRRPIVRHHNGRKEPDTSAQPRIGLYGPSSIGGPSFTANPIINGSLIASQAYTREIIKHLDSFAIDYFKDLLEEGEDQDLTSYIGSLSRSDSSVANRLRYVDLSNPQIGKVLSKNTYRVLHYPKGPHIRPLQALRSQFLPITTPITCSLHAIGGNYLFDELLLTAMAGIQPWDAFVSPGKSAAHLLNNLFCTTFEYLAERGMSISQPSINIPVIPWGVDIDRFFPRPKQTVRSDLGLPQGSPIILSLGRFSRMYKMDLEPLLQATIRLMKEPRIPPFVLVMAGADANGYAEDLRARVQDLGIRDRVLIIPNVSPVEVPLLLASADVFVSIPDNTQESFGISVVEAMASGLPVIVSDWSGHKDIVKNGVQGFVVPTYWAGISSEIDRAGQWMPWLKYQYFGAQSCVVDVSALTESIRALLTSPQLRSEMGQTAWDHARTYYSWNQVIGQYIELWEELNKISDRYVSSHENLIKSAPCMPVHNRSTHFPSFPTDWLKPTFAVTLTEAGRQAVSSRIPLVIGPSVEDVLTSRRALRVLSWVRAFSFLGREATVGDLNDFMEAHLQCSEEHSYRIIAWLAKVDLLSCTPRLEHREKERVGKSSGSYKA
jgi:D-inositol-3-phosphate glycosyltransferase